ncbi:MAG: hypothetical protein ALECFALPRED_002132 [Alectoria fallacina]|uniref:UBL3-like ubiquitin domain-containing protein n=1 Tax=Alectoria fallacina TaxID=1903189 RepID=A0A8H3IC51_9LECA|nr:MAG: hypothetical protein ALECFALPRED_002132 [Alectoria fallacina]
MAPVDGLSGATVDENSTGASDILSISLHESQPLQSTLPTSEPIERAHVDQQTAEDVPAKSIFGPFPTSAEASDDGQQGVTSAGSGNMPAPVPATTTDLIEYSKENRQTAIQSSLSPLDFDPQVGEHLKSTNANKLPNPDATTPPSLTREKTAPAIGPATDKPTPVPKESEIEGPVLFITLLLSSTGARHPYKLDEKYLRKRNVTVEGNNPINISLYKLKELILRDWRDEWESKPSSPESIRLISMGKMLNDKSRLSDSGFTNGLTPHIIHMTIKPQEIVDEEDAKMKSGGRDRDGNERSPGCRCIIQ